MGDARPLNVGIFFNARREQGGLYQYALTLAHCLHVHEPRHRYTLFHATLEPLPLALASPRWTLVELPRAALMPRLALEVMAMALTRYGVRRPLPALPAYPQMRAAHCDVMLYVKPSIQSFLWPYPAIFPIHDLQHRFQPEFPEVSAGGEWARREYLYRNAVPRAAAILADSEVGREDVLRAYPAAVPERVHALPYLAPTYLAAEVTDADIRRVRERYPLPVDFLFYPAAFWPHKNHARLLKALRVLRDRYDLRPALVLAGGRSREYERLVALAAELDLTEQVHFIGYVPDEDLYPLYRLARALVMPTFFGPTNIPILEAWALGCPVITSTARGLLEQVGDAGLLADPRDEGALADAIRRVLTDEPLRAALVERGRRKVAQWTPADFAGRLGAILEQSVR